MRDAQVNKELDNAYATTMASFSSIPIFSKNCCNCDSEDHFPTSFSNITVNRCNQETLL